MEEFSFVGKSVHRIDAPVKVTGEAKYCSDLMLVTPGLLEAKVLRSPYPHARILSIDTSQAERTVGVAAVVTGKDLSYRRYGPTWGTALDRYLLAREIVRFVGEPVVAVVAETSRAAEEALALINVEYEVLPPIFDAEEAMGHNPPVILHPDFNQYEIAPHNAAKLRGLNMPNVNAYSKIRQGDVERGFHEADLIVENRFSMGKVTHCQAETDCCIAQMDGDGILTVWTSTRAVYRVKEMLCRTFSLSPSRVRCISTYVGGAFGRWPEIEQIATLLTLKMRKPVRVVLSREEVFQFTPCRPAMVIYLKDGVKKDGSLVAEEMKAIVNGGAYAWLGAIYTDVAVFEAAATYRIPNRKVDAYNVYTNELPNTTRRGCGSSEVDWAIECQMDIIADKLGIDPVDFRNRNILNEGERNAIGEIVRSIGVRKCLDEAAEFIEWGKPCEKDMQPWKRGKGIAIGSHPTAPPPTGFGCVHVRVHEDATLELRHSSDEVGQGVNTVLAQMVAEEFGVPVEKVRVLRGDTAITPFDTGAAGSSTTFATGNAVKLACQDAKRQIFDLAAHKLKVSPHELRMADGNVFIEGLPERAISVSQLFLPTPLDRGGEIVGKGTYRCVYATPDPDTGQAEKINPCYTYGARAVEIAVNVETGEVKVLRIISAFDPGQPINIKLCEGQIEGGTDMAMAATLYEEMLMEQGEVCNANLRDYKVTTTIDIPSIQDMKSLILAAPHRDGPFGAKGLGEAVLVALAPAISNAIFDAVGVRMHHLPITPERLLAGINTAGLSETTERQKRLSQHRMQPRRQPPISFEYFEPLTIEEAVALLKRFGDKAKVLAGGTDLTVLMRERKIMPQYVICLGRIAGLSYVNLDAKKELRIGAMTTIRDIEQSVQLQPRYAVICEAASQLASVSVRNVATVGGNLCNAAPSADMAPPLMALSATARLVSTAGERIVSLDDFFTGPNTSVVKTDELLVEIHVPIPPIHTAGVYLKHKIKGGGGLGTVGVAVVLTLISGNGACADAKIVLGAAAPTPMRAREAEALLRGRNLDDELIENAARSASGESHCRDSIRGSAEYKRWLIKLLVRDALRQAAKLSKSVI